MFAFDSLMEVVEAAFAKAAITTTATLRDDRRVRRAASEAHDALPFVMRTAVRYSIGKDGFERFVLHLRDLMLKDGASTPTSLSRSRLQSIYANGPDFVRELMTAPPDRAPEKPLRAAQAAAQAVPARDGAALVTASNWHVLRADLQGGPYSDGEFLQLAEEGRLFPTDLVWREGLASWISLSDLPALAAAAQANAAGVEPAGSRLQAQ